MEIDAMNFIDTSMLQLMLKSAAAHLKNNRKLVDDLNVFPVPDGDTGTNMSLTFSGATDMVLAEENVHAGKTVMSLASAALRNARGNSGVILSQIIRGFSKALETKEGLAVSDIKDGLISAKSTAYRAVMKPTEGTILTVIREMSEFAAENFESFEDPTEFLAAVIDAGNKSLDNTTNILPALKKAGVVDAGGKGLMLLIEGAFVALKTGEAVVPVDKTASVASVKLESPVADIKFLYCTEFIINKKENRNISQFKTAISDKGDCMLVIDDEEIVKVHIHTNHPGFVLEQAVKLGELTNLKIDNMKYQHNERAEDNASSVSDDNEDLSAKEPTKKYGFAAVSAGDGLSEIFRSLNVDEIIEGGQTMNPSTQDLLSAVEKIPAEIVYILPNNKNIILAADQVDALTDKQVYVVPTVNIPEGISAMTAFDEGLDEASNLEAMKDFASLVKCGQVTFAARDTNLDGMEIKMGDCLAVFGKEISAVTKTPEESAIALCEKMVDDESGVITVYYGEDISEETAQALAKSLEDKYPDLDVSVICGSQPVYFYIISVE
jgi:DAK2 domain fusion protein YloV